MGRLANASAHLARVGRLEADRNVAGLIAELKSDEGLGRFMLVRGHAALALGRLGDTRAVPYLAELASDPESVIRTDALLALGMLADRQGLTALLTGLSDLDPGVRMAAAEALGKLGDTRAIAVLRDALDSDPNAEVRLHAADALVTLGDEEVVARIPEVIRSVSWRVRRHPRWRKLAEQAASVAGQP